jgi:hypothetical protein
VEIAAAVARRGDLDAVLDAVASLPEEIFEFVFTSDASRLFFHAGYRGTIVELDLADNTRLRTADMTPGNDGPTSPFYPPPWYRGSVVGPNEYLFADFGGDGPGGIWKFGSEMEAPSPLLRMVDGPARVFGLAFGTDAVFVLIREENEGRLQTKTQRRANLRTSARFGGHCF